MDDQMTVESVQEQSLEAAHQATQDQSPEQQVSQHANDAQQSLDSAERSLDYQSDSLAEDVTKSAGQDLGNAVQACLDSGQQAIDRAQQQSGNFFDQLEQGLESADPDQRDALLQLGQEASEAAKKVAAGSEDVGNRLANDVCDALDNSEPEAIRDAARQAEQDNTAIRDEFEKTMADLERRLNEIAPESSQAAEADRNQRQDADRELTEEDIDRFFENLEIAGKGLQERPMELNIDEKRAVNENGISDEERMNRALDLLNNRDFKDSTTNQATKNNFVDQSLDRTQEQKEPVSVKDDPSALFTREWKDVKEMREICEHVLNNAKLEGKNADQVKEALNRGLREEMKNPKTEAGKAVNEALRDLMNKQENENDFFKKKR
jgi:hypothetical protein